MKQISRREFFKKGAMALAAVVLPASVIQKVAPKKVTEWPSLLEAVRIGPSMSARKMLEGGMLHVYAGSIPADADGSDGRCIMEIKL